MVAEATSLRLAASLTHLCVPRLGAITVLGDNLPVLRLAAGHGRLTMAAAWPILEAPLLHIATHGWTCRWAAVRRCFNGTADNLATRGTHKAVQARSLAVPDLTPRIWIWVHPLLRAALGPHLCMPWFHNWPTTELATQPAPTTPSAPPPRRAAPSHAGRSVLPRLR
jgi:hypothetical protein